jgi:hypothetical protein
LNGPKANARSTGVLFIPGTVPVIVATQLWGQSALSPDYLSSMAANGSKTFYMHSPSWSWD